MLSVGVDIGSYSIKLVAAKMAGTRYEVVRAEEFRFSTKPNADISLETLEHLKHIVSLFNTGQARFVLALPDRHVCTRSIFFPFKEKHKILKTLAFELEDKIPFSMHNSVCDVQMGRPMLGGVQTLGVAALKDKIGGYLETLKTSGLQPYVLGVESLAFANVFLLSQKNAKAERSKYCDVLLDFGHQSTKVVLVSGQYILDVGSVDWGMHNVIEAIAHKYSLGYLEALGGVRSKGLKVLLDYKDASRRDTALSQVVKKAFGPFLRELMLLLTECQSEHSVQCGRVLCSGWGARIENVAGLITQGINMPVHVFDETGTGVRGDWSLKEHPSYLGALGLALEGFKRSSTRGPNFLKGAFKPSGQDIGAMFKRWRVGLSSAVALYCLACVWGVWSASLGQRLSDDTYAALTKHAVSITGLPRSQVKVPTIQSYIDSADARKKFYASYESWQKAPSALHVLARLSELMPKTSLVVQKFLFEPSVLKIAGQGEPTDVRALREGLKNLGLSVEVNDLAAGERPEGAGFGFEVQIKSL